jgi:nucleotide-binding universal stress UspA family protein
MSGIKRFLLGSTSRALIGETLRPVLVVPEITLEPAVA